jgi:hypothetical protein
MAVAPIGVPDTGRVRGFVIDSRGVKPIEGVFVGRVFCFVELMQSEGDSIEKMMTESLDASMKRPCFVKAKGHSSPSCDKIRKLMRKDLKWMPIFVSSTLVDDSECRLIKIDIEEFAGKVKTSDGTSIDRTKLIKKYDDLSVAYNTKVIQEWIDHVKDTLSVTA